MGWTSSLPKLPEDSPELRALCHRLVPGEIPGYVEIEEPPGVQAKDCIGNVERLIAAYGGAFEYGWRLHETMPGVMLEAEFHAVWIDRQGHRRDVTPSGVGLKRCAFLSDLTLVYEGRQIDNVRVTLRDDPLIADFIAECEAYFEATNRGDLALRHGDIDQYLTPEARRELARITKRRADLARRIAQRYYGMP